MPHDSNEKGWRPLTNSSLVDRISSSVVGRFHRHVKGERSAQVEKYTRTNPETTFASIGRDLQATSNGHATRLGDGQSMLTELIRTALRVPSQRMHLLEKHSLEVGDLAMRTEHSVNRARVAIGQTVVERRMSDKFTTTTREVLLELLTRNAGQSAHFSAQSAGRALSTIVTLVYTIAMRPDRRHMITTVYLWLPAFEQIGRTLVGFERVLGLVGYRAAELQMTSNDNDYVDGSASKVLYLNTNVSSDKLLDVYQDLVVAWEEMRLWQQIYNELTDSNALQQYYGLDGATADNVCALTTWKLISDVQMKQHGSLDERVVACIDELKDEMSLVQFDMGNLP